MRTQGLKRNQFKNLISLGNRFYCSCFKIYYLKSETNSLAVTTSKKLGNAVFRNKMRKRFFFMHDNFMKSHMNRKNNITIWIVMNNKSDSNFIYADLFKEFKRFFDFIFLKNF
jgi:ribonuclease P protein component